MLTAPDTAKLGALFPAHADPSGLSSFAAALEALGLAHLWLAEDCFLSSGPVMAATALASSETLAVGIGLMPVSVRNAAIAAMEIATLGRLYPGRFTAAFGHGVEAWMQQIQARPAHRLAALAETVAAVRSLVSGEMVDTDGEYVTLRNVKLEHPVPIPPLIMVGATGPRGLAIAAGHGDGVVLPEGCPPAFVQWAVQQVRAAAPRARRKRCVAYCWLALEDTAEDACELLAPRITGWLESSLFAAPKRCFGVTGQRSLRERELHLVAQRASICGTAPDCAVAVRAFLAAGVDTLVLVPAADHAEAQLERFVTEVKPLLALAP